MHREVQCGVVGEGADTSLYFRHGGSGRRRQRESRAQRAALGVGALVGRVDRQEVKHAPELRVWFAVRKEMVDDIHHTAEHGGADSLAFLLVGGAGEHLVK